MISWPPIDRAAMDSSAPAVWEIATLVAFGPKSHWVWPKNLCPINPTPSACHGFPCFSPEKERSIGCPPVLRVMKCHKCWAARTKGKLKSCPAKVWVDRNSWPRNEPNNFRSQVVTMTDWLTDQNYFTSSDPHRDIILLHICPKFWHSLCEDEEERITLWSIWPMW